MLLIMLTILDDLLGTECALTVQPHRCMAFGRSSDGISLSSLESSTSLPELSLRRHSAPTADRK